MSQNICGTFVSEKVNKIRWRPDPFNNSHSFITGSWDNLQENTIKLWDFQEGETDTDIYPFVAHATLVTDDVTELTVILYLRITKQILSVQTVSRFRSFSGFILGWQCETLQNRGGYRGRHPSNC